MTDEAHQPTPQPAGDLGTASSQARVQFVGTGPGDPNLLTLGAVDAINRAQVIVISCAEHRMLLGSDFLGNHCYLQFFRKYTKNYIFMFFLFHGLFPPRPGVHCG